MIVTHRNNRLAPVIIIAVCVVMFFYMASPYQGSYDLASSSDSTLADAPTKDGAVIDTSKSSANVTVADDYTTNEPPTSQSTTNEKWQHASADGSSLTRDDVLLIMKTGGTTMWKRLLIHLTTTFEGESTKNTVIYSDLADKLGKFEIVDALANMTDAAKSEPDFDVYKQLPDYIANNYYVEASGVNGDEWGPQGGWIIDKYKFVPLMQHAGENWPKAKWYVYMEDDTYLFMPNIIAYLSKFDWRKPHYLGSFAAKSNVVFAHGGAGFAVSRGAWEKSFGQNSNMTNEYYKYTADHCCGDQVLAHALEDHGVKFGENGGDGKFTWGFNPVVHWIFAFSQHNWCHPLMSWHKVHSRDVSQYHEIETSWDFSKPLLHKDFFIQKILPSIQKPIQWWDNMASLYEISSANKDAPPPPDGKYDAALWSNAWESVEACEAGCKGWEHCVQWTYVEDLCKMDDKMIMGQGYAAAMSQRKTSLMHTSGWLPDRLDKWACA